MIVKKPDLLNAKFSVCYKTALHHDDSRLQHGILGTKSYTNASVLVVKRISYVESIDLP